MTNDQLKEALESLIGDDPKRELRVLLEFYASSKYNGDKETKFLIEVERVEARLNEE